MRLNPVKFGEVEHLDRHHIAILEFIKNTPRCTENQVVKAMQEQRECSKMTTLRKLDQLIEKLEIKDLLKEEGGFHRFIVNEHNEFNQITEALSKIEAIVNPIEKFQNLVKERRLQKHPMDRSIDEYYVLFEQDFFLTLNMLLISLLTRTNISIQSEKDAQILYTKNIQLLTKLDVMTGPPKKLFDIQRKNLEAGQNAWRSTVRKIKSELKSGVPKSEYKHVLESLETEEDIFKMRNQLNENLIKIVHGCHVFDIPNIYGQN